MTIVILMVIMYIINDNDLTWQATGMILIELDYLKMAEPCMEHSRRVVL